MHPNENALQEQNEDLHHKPRNNPGDHCAECGVLSTGRSFLRDCCRHLSFDRRVNSAGALI